MDGAEMDKSLSQRMAEAARELQDQDDPAATMLSAVRLAVEDVRGADAAAVSIVRGRAKVETPASTEEMAERADQLQYDTGQGPCLDAIWEEGLVYSADLGSDERWPTWGPRVVAETGARSLMAFRLFTQEDTLGALNLYSRSDNGFDAQDRDDGLAIAAHISVAVAAAEKISQLDSALHSRTVISQAVGILMERYGLGSDVAFSVLSRTASTTHTKLRDVAIELCTTRMLRTDEAAETAEASA